jgi:hypothetical protein
VRVWSEKEGKKVEAVIPIILMEALFGCEEWSITLDTKVL